MAVLQIEIEQFISLAETHPVLDVRSPGEYNHAHIPGALALPLFTDDQRKIIGTAYKQQGRQIAVKIGLDYFSERMKIIPPEVEEKCTQWYRDRELKDPGIISTPALVHCWRGGMRSGAVAWLLNLYGFKIYTLKGGYKAFRNWVLLQFEKGYKLNILGGFTGSGKTNLLRKMKEKGAFVIDLEALANHRGSAFGSLGENPQPGQEMFENMLALELFRISKMIQRGIDFSKINNNAVPFEIWVEDESRHIGLAGIPKKFWDQMRNNPLYFLDIPFEERLHQIVSDYGSFSKDDLANSIIKIQKRLGGLEAKNALNFLNENRISDCFSILLHYYDKLYYNSLNKRENIETVLNKIPCKTVDVKNAEKLLAQKA